MTRRVSTRASTCGPDPFGNDRSRPATPVRVLLRVTGLPVLALLLLAIGCGLAGSGGGGEGDAPEGVSHGGAGGDPTPVLTGSWSGTISDPTGGEGRLALNLEQGAGGKLKGTGSIALNEDAAEAIEGVAGRVEGPGDVTLTYDAGGEGNARWTFRGGLEDGSISEMRGDVEIAYDTEDGERETETGTFALTRYPDLSSDPRALAVAAVQAVYDRNFSFLAENAHPDYEDFLQEERYPRDFSAPTFAGAIENQFEYETSYMDGEEPPPAGVTVQFDEASVREEGQEGSEYYIIFDHGLSGGGEGYAQVALKTAGVDEEASWRVNGIGLEYGDNERLTLADNY